MAGFTNEVAHHDHHHGHHHCPHHRHHHHHHHHHHHDRMITNEVAHVEAVYRRGDPEMTLKRMAVAN
eukprot:704403-Karenia_brevis.AAC.1